MATRHCVVCGVVEHVTTGGHVGVGRVGHWEQVEATGVTGSGHVTGQPVPGEHPTSSSAVQAPSPAPLTALTLTVVPGILSSGSVITKVSPGLTSRSCPPENCILYWTMCPLGRMGSCHTITVHKYCTLLGTSGTPSLVIVEISHSRMLALSASKSLTPLWVVTRMMYALKGTNPETSYVTMLPPSMRLSVATMNSPIR